MRFRRRRDRHDTRRQLTSVSVSLTGASLSWDTERTERRRARDALHRLEDHRALYAPHDAEFPEPVVRSLERLRAYLTEQIPTCESVELRDGLREIQAAVREFLTRVGYDYGPPQAVPHDFWQSLDALRARVGPAAATLATTFGVTVDGDLARIVRGADADADAGAGGDGGGA